MNDRERLDKWYKTKGCAIVGYRAVVEAAWQEARRWIPVRKVGSFGRYYDPPTEKRAYSHGNGDPGNMVASKLGRAVRNAAAAPAGDNIDTGLALLRFLANEGFGVFELEEPPDEQEAG